MASNQDGGFTILNMDNPESIILVFNAIVQMHMWHPQLARLQYNEVRSVQSIQCRSFVQLILGMVVVGV